MKIIKNFSFLTIAQIAEKVLNLVIVVLLARYLGARGYGIYALAIAFVGLFNYLFDAGLNLLLTREVGRQREKIGEILRPVLKLKLVLGVITLAIIAILAWLLGYHGKVLYSIMLFGLAGFMVSLSCTFRAYFIGHEKMEFEGGLSVLYRLLALLFVILCIFFGIGMPLLMISHVLAGAMVLGLSIYLYKNLFYQSSHETEKCQLNLFALLKDALPFAVGAIMGEIYFNIDKVMLSKLAGVESVGYYNAAYRVFFFGVFIANSITISAYPYFAKMWHEDKHLAEQLFNSIFKLLFLISLPIAIVITFLSGDIILFLFGKDYYQSALLLKLLIWGLLPLYLTHLTGRTMEAIGEQRFVAKTMSLGVLINIILNAALIPLLGMAGAVFATLITSFMVLFAHLIFLRQRLKGIFLLDYIKAALLPSIGCAFAAYLLIKYSSWMIAFPISLIFYMVLLFSLKGITMDEIAILRGGIKSL